MAEAKPENPEQRVGFYIRELDAGCYSVRLDLMNLVADAALVRHFHHWMITRMPEDRIYLYMENGATMNLWVAGNGCLYNVANLIKAIQLCPAYNNLVMVITQMVTGAASYLILSTPKIKWAPLGFVSFDGWLSGKEIDQYDQAVRSDIVWIRQLFRKGLATGLFSEKDVKDHEEGRMVVLGIRKTRESA